MRSRVKAQLAALGLLPLSACGLFGSHEEARPRLEVATPTDSEAPAAVPAKAAFQPIAEEKLYLGAPYMIDGKTYSPADVVSLDEVGYAAILWETADGRRTASGEPYVAEAISAAHRTLPLPSYVEVTSLESGRTILVRVNERGPMLNDHVIALSPGAARQLGIKSDGMAAVRVRKVNPPQQERDALRAGRQAAERLETPPGLRAALIKRLPAAPLPIDGPVRTASGGATGVPKPASSVQSVPVEPAAVAPAVVPEHKVVAVQHTAAEPNAASVQVASPTRPAAVKPAPVRAAPAKVARAGGLVIQVAALSSREKADQLAHVLGGTVTPAGKLFRVRTGPYGTQAEGNNALKTIRSKGYADARLMVNDGR